VYVYRATLPRNVGGIPGGSRTPTWNQGLTIVHFIA
jgi:hypothetical protein